MIKKFCSFLLMAPFMAISWVWAQYKKWRGPAKEPKVTIHVPNWESDMVYLIQVPCSPRIRSLSPFALKLETFLRLAKIPYKNVYTLKMNNRGQTPYIELNGEQYPDSNLIIDMLKEKFNVNPDKDLSEEQLVLSHMTRVMVENHTMSYVFYWRYVYRYEELLRYSNMDGVSDFMISVMKAVFPSLIRFRYYLQGISRHTDEQMADICNADLNAISKTLGTKNFYLTKDVPTTVDCVLFGHLAQIHYLPIDYPQKAYLFQKAPNLEKYLDRMKNLLWPDWEEMCDKKSMEGKKSKFYM